MGAIHVTAENFEKEVLQSEIPVLVDFWAQWCGPCRMLMPTVEEIAAEAKDFKVCKINIDEEMDLAQKYRVMTIPTLMVFKNGQPVETSVGAKPRAAILKMLGK